MLNFLLLRERTMFGWLFSSKKKSSDGVQDFRTAISIDVSDPEFDDMGPSVDRLRERFRTTNSISGDLVNLVVEIAPSHFRGAGSVKGCLRELRRRATGAAKEEIATIERFLHLEVSRASKLHNLRRARDAGCTTFILRSANDERDTPLERKLNGKKISYDRALKLIEDRGDEISRSIISAVVKF
jgi:hypothetical protein